MGFLPVGKRQEITHFQTQFLGVGIVFFTISAIAQSVLALPPPEDTPEEVLRTEIFLTARSPVDGKSLTAAQYAQLQAKLQTRPAPPTLNSQVREIVFLLQLRKAIRTFLPFLPI
ncbi:MULTISPECIES: hypothetical protein [Chroococcidiopsis]|uniref:Glutathione S-transferase n=1 Tax=Chroococcidiopsis thermalis (strain PCC 7203) TaxID=251229 RepID=K9TWV3_CHRTP|nr:MULTISPECIES: hypothetical protein [Chroococcidiopsis]AFY86671.1 hypothetical protein Chro_1142 [Chroococcidiopsis thermalis PCC 7203]URD51551.1 hypothetical protein M5J74_06075 [Chroococcidiopsis sp. CCNUC1]